MFTRWRKIAAWLSIAAAVLASTAVYYWYWERPQRAIRRAMDALDNSDADGFESALADLQGTSGFIPQQTFLYGAWLYKANQPAQAFEALSKVRPEGELRVPVLLWVGKCLYKLERYGEAERCFNQIVGEHPAHIAARRWLVAVYNAMGANAFSMTTLKQLAKLEPNYEVFHLIGVIYDLDYDEHLPAIENYRLALAHNPPEELRRQYQRELARCLVIQREFDEALSTLADLPEDPYINTLRSDCYLHLGDRKTARELLDRAKAQAPDYSELLFLEARMQLDEGLIQESLVPLQRLLERDPHDYRSRYQLALAYQRLGDQAAAKTELEKMRHSRELRDKLTNLYNSAMRDVDNCEIRDRIGAVCDELGQRRLAIIWLRAAEQCRRASESSPGN